jgi:tRNA(adenine34) deaminase
LTEAISRDEEFMARALELALRAEAQGEVPIGAVVVRGGAMVGEGWNRNIADHDPSAHAEIIALREAGLALANHRVPGCDLFVTLEPCAMCVGAMIHARIQRVVFAAADPKTGALGGAYDLQELSHHNHRLEVSSGIMGDEAADLLRSFFRRRRIQGDESRPGS